MLRIPLPISSHTKSAAKREAWRESVRPLLRALRRPDSELVTLVLDFHAPWRKPNGKLDPHLPDVTRLVTILEDLIAEACGYNDRENWRVVLNRVPSMDSYCVVWLRPWSLPMPGS